MSIRGRNGLIVGFDHDRHKVQLALKSVAPRLQISDRSRIDYFAIGVIASANKPEKNP